MIMENIDHFRRNESLHVPNQAAKTRANQRAAKRNCKGKSNRIKLHHRDATRVATLNEEMNLFKEITRAIIKHDAKQEDDGLVHMEKKQHLRRLAGLGVYRHQPAINAFVKTTGQQQDTITIAIIGQKMGATTKTTKACDDFRQHSIHGETMKLKIMRIA